MLMATLVQVQSWSGHHMAVEMFEVMAWCGETHHLWFTRFNGRWDVVLCTCHQSGQHPLINERRVHINGYNPHL